MHLCALGNTRSGRCPVAHVALASASASSNSLAASVCMPRGRVRAYLPPARHYAPYAAPVPLAQCVGHSPRSSHHALHALLACAAGMRAGMVCSRVPRPSDHVTGTARHRRVPWRQRHPLHRRAEATGRPPTQLATRFFLLFAAVVFLSSLVGGGVGVIVLEPTRDKRGHGLLAAAALTLFIFTRGL